MKKVSLGQGQVMEGISSTTTIHNFTGYENHWKMSHFGLFLSKENVEKIVSYQREKSEKNQNQMRLFFWLFSNIVYLSSQLTLAWFDLIKIASFLLQTLGKLNCWRWKDNCSKEICHFDFTWQHLLTKISVLYQYLKRLFSNFL